MAYDKVTPGIHSDAKSAMSEHFTKEEIKIIRIWQKEWYVTFASKTKYGQTTFKYFLVKPTSNLEETIGVSREIVVVIHPYESFEARDLEVYERIYKQFPNEKRIERICYVIVSKCLDIDERLGAYTGSSKETQVIIPFTYDSFLNANSDPYFLRNRFWKYFHTRDLFGLKSPLKEDYYFFGRNEISMDIIHHHKEGENTGLSLVPYCNL